MRVVLGVLLLVSAAAWAVPDGGQEREIVAAKERLQAMLDEAALLEQAGRREEAARVREEAVALKKRIAGVREKPDDAPKDPLHEALHRLEQAIGALDRAGYEGMAGHLREAADKLRAQIKQRDGDRERQRGEPDARRERGGGPEQDADFWRRNTGTLVVAMKALEEAEKRDAADLMERAIHARKVMVAGRKDDEAREIMKKGPEDGKLAGLLFMAADCWREFKQPEKAEQCLELGNFLKGRAQEGRGERPKREMREGPGPEDRMARLEERLDRLERMLREAFERLEERERGRDRR